MKKLILSLAFVAAGAASYAQIGQGSLMLGGSFGFESNGGGTTKTTVTGATIPDVELTARTSWNFSPSIGYFVTDNIAVGLRLGLGGQTLYEAISTDGKTKENVSSFNLGVELFGRYYMELGSNFYFFGDAGLGYSSRSWTDRNSNAAKPAELEDGNKNTVGSIGLNIAPGVAFFPSEKWGIDFTLNRVIGFNMNTNTAEAPAPGGKVETSTTDFGIGLGLNPSLGLHYYMGK